MKHLPFQSIYRPDFDVVEQRQGNLSFYPHTDQLALLLRALTLEFHGALPRRIARADKRTDDFRKIVLHLAALMFCTGANASRPDQLRLFRLLNPDLVSEVAIVQQITETTPRGPCHRFRFYARDDFFPEIYLSGKRLVFADHVLQRFSARVPNNVGEDLTIFLLTFFGSPIIAMPVGPGRAFILPYLGSILAFTYQETDTEFFVTTCLTINEIHSLVTELPPETFNLHYGPAFTRPLARHWLPTQWMMNHYKCWQRKTPLPPARPAPAKFHWHSVANWVKGHEIKSGHGPRSRLLFLDHVPGPCAMELRPDQPEPRFNELEGYKRENPKYDWDAFFAARGDRAP